MSALDLLASDPNLSPAFAAYFRRETHTEPAVRPTLHDKAMASLAAAIRDVQACHTPGRFDCDEVLELLGDALILLDDVRAVE